VCALGVPASERERRDLFFQNSTAADGETSAANPAGGTRHALRSCAGQPLTTPSGCPAGGWEEGQRNKAAIHSLPFGGIHTVSSEGMNQKGKYTLQVLSGIAVFVSLKRCSGMLEGYTGVHQLLVKLGWTSKFLGDFQGR